MSYSSFESILKSGFPVRTDNENATALLGLLQRVGQGYAREAAEIRADANLSDVGRREKIEQLAKQHVSQAEKLTTADRNLLAAVGARGQELRTRARRYEPQAPKDPVAEIRAQEIRAALRVLEPAARADAVATAVASGEGDVFAALLHDPLGTLSPLLPESILAELRSAWLSKHESGLADAIKSVDDLYSQLEVAVADLREGILKDAGLYEREPVRS